jgi:phytoene synthase
VSRDPRGRGESAAVALALVASSRVIHNHSKTFSLATSFLPPRERRAIRALYAFCRATDDLVDAGDALLEDVEAWRAQIDRPTDRQTSPILQAWVETRQEFGIDPRYEQELIDGVALDLTCTRYQTWAELERYCYHVAATVGLMSIPVLGLADGVAFKEAAPFAIRLGEALQLTNILRDVGEDAARGRVYLPESDLRRFGLTPADVLAGVSDDRFRRVMQYEIARARMLYRQALPGIRLLAPSGRFAAGAAALLYREILNEIEKLDYDVHRHRAHTSAFRKLSRLPGILWTLVRLKTPSFPLESSLSGGHRQDASAA